VATNYRLCLFCHHLFEGSIKTVARCPECQAGPERGWSVNLDNAKAEDLAALIPAMVRKFESVNERLDRLEGMLVP